MSRFLTLSLFVLAVGCNSGPVPSGQDVDSTAQTTLQPPSSFQDRVWVRQDTTGLPGVMRIFLSDGTLVMDSCWETYRLARWEAVGDSVVRWQEDTATIEARLESVDSAALSLRLQLPGDTLLETYRAAEAPYVCPDMKR